MTTLRTFALSAAVIAAIAVGTIASEAKAAPPHGTSGAQASQILNSVFGGVSKIIHGPPHYPRPVWGQPGYVHPTPTYVHPIHVHPGYSRPGYVHPGYGRPGYGRPSYSRPSHWGYGWR